LAELKEHELRARGRDPKLEVKQIPEVILFAQTSQGGLQAIDGETGRTIWYVQVGVPSHPTQPIAATDQHVVTINGSYLYVFDQQSGRPLWQRPISGVPTAGPALGRGLIYVPTLNGMVEAFQEDGTEARGCAETGIARPARAAAPPPPVTWSREPTAGSARRATGTTSRSSGGASPGGTHPRLHTRRRRSLRRTCTAPRPARPPRRSPRSTRTRAWRGTPPARRPRQGGARC